MFENLEPLDPALKTQKIYRLADYAHLERILVIPLLHIEFTTIARYWPIAWIKSESEYIPVAVLGFSYRQTLQERLEKAPPDAIPIALKAFPLKLGNANEDGEAQILIHPPPPAIDPSAGEHVFSADGSLSPAASLRADFLWLNAAEEKRTRALSRRIAELDGFELWKLQVVFVDASVTNTQFYVVTSDFLTGARYLQLASEFGSDIVMSMEHHVLSRLRVQSLADEMSRDGEKRTQS